MIRRIRLQPRTAAIARAVALGVAVVLLLIAAGGLSLVMWVRPGLVAQFAGVTVTPSGGVRVVGRQMSPRAVGDRTIYGLAAEEGTAAASLLPTAFPVPPGAAVTRSAVYRDAQVTYQSAVVNAPMSESAIQQWYRAELESDGWTVEELVRVERDSYRILLHPSPLVARKRDVTARLEFAEGNGLGAQRRSGLVVTATPDAGVVGILVTTP